MPLTPPFSLINSLSLRAFNALYYHRLRGRVQHALTHYEPYFYPLDAIGGWNRLYGPRGFLQYQCVLPPTQAEAALTELLARIAASGSGSFLAVLKVFGERQVRWYPLVPAARRHPGAGLPQQRSGHVHAARCAG